MREPVVSQAAHATEAFSTASAQLVCCQEDKRCTAVT